MNSAYLLIVASAALVMCEPQRSNNDIIWFPVDNEDGVFVSIYGEKRRTPSPSKWRSHRRARYSGMEDYPSYIPPPENDDPSFFHNIHDRRPFRRPNGFQQYPPVFSQNFRPFHDSESNQKLVSFDDNRDAQRPDYQGLNDDNLQEVINEVFNVNKNPSTNQFPGQRPLPENRPSGSELFTTTTRRPFQRPTTNEWFVNPKPSQRPTTNEWVVNPKPSQRPMTNEWVVNPKPSQRPTTNEWVVNPKPSQRPGIVRPNRPNSQAVVFPGEAANTTPTTPTPTDLLPTETTTLTPCERMCPVTLEFNPVCGTDSFNYSNLGRLKCAKACGKDVQLSHFGQCGRGRTARPPRQEFTLLKALGL